MIHVTNDKRLTSKYNVAAPRYTSYPTVPYWDPENWGEQKWMESMEKILNENQYPEVSLYIHLPYCESLCTYCGCNTRITKNHRVEDPYIDSVLHEWQLYQQHLARPLTISELHLGGGTPTFFSAKNLERLVAGLVNGIQISPNACFSFEAHPTNTSREHLTVLHGLGFNRLSLGIQDFDPQVQFVINRHQTEDEVWSVLTQAREMGYTSINFDLIYGLPLQKQQSIIDTLTTVTQMKPDRISFYSYAHVPWLKPGQRRYTEADLPKDDEKLDLYLTGKKMLTAAGYRDVGMDHFALAHDSLFQAAQKNTMHRNFMGYTDTYAPLLIGLGVSAISDSWYGFSQNVKQVEAYIGLVSQNRLPVLKGHLLTLEDLILRQHILNIMCNGKTSWNPTSISLKEVFERLIPLANDGLVELEAGRATVTPAGKSFLRIICMAFDKRLHEQHPVTDTFSKAI